MNRELLPSASYSLTVRLELGDRPGTLGRATSAIGEVGFNIGAIDLVRVGRSVLVRDVTIACRDEAHGQAIVRRLESIEGLRVLAVSDRTFLVHLGGKIEIASRVPVKTRDDLSMVYTPGVARVCLAIRDDPGKQWALTVKRHMVAVITDGSAVLGLGNIGAAAAQPVMEGKCAIFKTFGEVDAFPLCLSTQDADEIVATVERIAPVFGGINLEDIAAPKCFEIEERLRGALDIPVMHDDQHGTTVVVLAALTNALKLVGKALEEVKIVVAGAGAAGVATARMLARTGARRLVLCDRVGALYPGRTEALTSVKEAVARETNPDREQGTVRGPAEGRRLHRAVRARGDRSRGRGVHWRTIPSCSRWPSRRSNRKFSRASRGSSRPAEAITPTRSTIPSGSPASSGAPWTCRQRRSTKG